MMSWLNTNNQVESCSWDYTYLYNMDMHVSHVLYVYTEHHVAKSCFDGHSLM